MRITYVTHTRFPTEKAHGFQVASVCQALARLGHTVALLTPTVGNAIEENPLAYYGMPSSAFSVVRLQNFDALSSRWVPGKLAFFVAMHSFRHALSAFLPLHHTDLFYARTPQVLPPLLATGIPVVLELHTLPRMARRAFLMRCRRCIAVICLTQTMRDVLLSWGLDAEHVFVEGDAVDLIRFTLSERSESNGFSPQKEKAKAQWLLPQGRPIIGYVGSLVTGDALEKGVRELIDAVALLQTQGRAVFGWIVGGPNVWREKYIREARTRGLSENDVRLEGIIPFAAAPSALCSCDVLVYTAPASGHPYFTRDTSPLKLFEYMAAGRPIVCADLPPLRDVVDESVVRFCIPGDPQSLADALAWVLDHPEEARQMAERAKERVKRYSWEARMERILVSMSRFCSSLSPRGEGRVRGKVVRYIEKNGTLYALIIPRGVSVDGARFLTPPESPLQVGVMERPAGYVVQPHRHPPVSLKISSVSEFLCIERGRVKAVIYDDAWGVVGEELLTAGDAILLLAGGHSFEVLEPCRMVEVKQGPFLGDQSKVYRFS